MGSNKLSSTNAAKTYTGSKMKLVITVGSDYTATLTAISTGNFYVVDFTSNTVKTVKVTAGNTIVSCTGIHNFIVIAL